MENFKSMVDIAYDALIAAKGAMSFYDMFDKVQELRNFDSEAIDEKRSLFYTNVTLDGRFITLGENLWDLRERHLFSEVHIDMNDIYSDDDDDDAEVDDEEDND